MILYINSFSQKQNTYKYCFDRNELEILAKSNLERLQYIELYDTALSEICNLNRQIELYNIKYVYTSDLNDSLHYYNILLHAANTNLKEDNSKHIKKIKKYKIIMLANILIIIILVI